MEDKIEKIDDKIAVTTYYDPSELQGKLDGLIEQRDYMNKNFDDQISKLKDQLGLK